MGWSPGIKLFNIGLPDIIKDITGYNGKFPWLTVFC
jgi:hypothetical protein